MVVKGDDHGLVGAVGQRESSPAAKRLNKGFGLGLGGFESRRLNVGGIHAGRAVNQ